VEYLKVLHSGKPWPYSQTLERLNREKYSSLIQTFVKGGYKSFITLGLGVNVIKPFLFVTDEEAI
jgi:hypothetical protein